MSTRRLKFATLFSLFTLWLTLVIAGTAGAYATLEGPPIYSTAPGLPDGRVYELASPPDKNGNQAGAATLHLAGPLPGSLRYGIASAEGNSVLFEATGPMGEAPAANVLFYVATRTDSGWKTRSVLPRPQQTANEISTIEGKPGSIDLSPDFSHAMVEAKEYTLAPLPNEKCFYQTYLTGSDPFVSATWLNRPEIGNPISFCYDAQAENGLPVGGSPDFSTVYFSYPGTLLPEDAPRAQHADGEAWGFYEYSKGTLHEEGVLPDGSLDPYGAVPAASGHGIALSGNQVSADGSRAFFVSPDPASCEQNGGKNNCTLDPPELYVRENGNKTLLVSRDTLSPGVGESPAPAPHGVLLLDQASYSASLNSSYVFASRDGSQAFFQSEDQLASGAPEGPPGDTSPKTYDFDVNTGTLTYLPGVVGRILGSSEDGSSIVFVRAATRSSLAELDLWTAGPSGGSVTPITQLPGGEGVETVRMSSDGSVVVFITSGLSGFNDAGASDIFRYDAATNMLGCVSCSPTGVTPSSATMSALQQVIDEHENIDPGMIDERGMSSDGDRVFFQTPAPLVSQDTNTGTTVPAIEHEGVEAQGDDVYEWENGVVYLISTGKSARNSYFIDNSESGNDVYFSTTEDLVPGDTDGGYSVFDARVPRPGDNPPPAAVPCQGSVCQGPPRVQAPLGAPASATFSGLGNVASEPLVKSVANTKPKSKSVKCKKGLVKEKGKCVKVKAKKAKKSAKGSK